MFESFVIQSEEQVIPPGFPVYRDELFAHVQVYYCDCTVDILLPRRLGVTVRSVFCIHILFSTFFLRKNKMTARHAQSSVLKRLSVLSVNF